MYCLEHGIMPGGSIPNKAEAPTKIGKIDASFGTFFSETDSESIQKASWIICETRIT